MKNKKAKLIIPSLLTILGCIALGTGSTYSLFTSESTNSITISSGKVDVTSSLSIDSLYSPTTIDSNGNMSGNSSSKTDEKNGTFYSGSISIDDEGNIKLNNLLPGDKAILKVEIKNNSTIKTNYNISLTSTDGLSLYSMLDIKILDNSSDTTLSSDFTKGVSSIRSKTYSLDSTDSESVSNKYLSIEVPSSLSYGMGLSTKLSLKVEAIQGNGSSDFIYTLPNGITSQSFESASEVHRYYNNNSNKIENVAATAYFNGVYFDGLNSALCYVNNEYSGSEDPIIYLKPNCTTTNELWDHPSVTKNITIYGNNATLKDSKGEISLNSSDVLTSDISIKVYDLKGLNFWGNHTSTSYKVDFYAYNSEITKVLINNNVTTQDLNMTFDTCTFTAISGSDGAIYANSNGTITLKNSVINGFNNGFNLNHKVNGTQVVKVIDSSFIDCATTGSQAYYAPIRMYQKESGAIAKLIIKNSNAYYSPSKANINTHDILLNKIHNGSYAKGSIEYKIEDSNMSIETGLDGENGTSKVTKNDSLTA